MQKNKDINIELVHFPYFFLYDENNSQKKNLNFNKIFWDDIFSKKVLKYVDIKNLTPEETIDLKYIFKNIQLAKNIFLLLKEKNIGIHHLFFSFNIINSLLQIINKNLLYEKIYFYNYFWYSDELKANVENTLIYKFFLSNITPILIDFDLETTFNIDLYLSEQIIQIEILKNILEKHNKKISLNINLTKLREFENKLSIKNTLNDLFSGTTINIVLINENLSNNTSLENSVNTQILGYKNINQYIYNKGCNYRKCVFCNIGKFLPKVKDETDIILQDIIDLNKNGKIQTFHVSDPDIQPEEILYISEKFSKNKADIKMHIRTRFSKKYTLEVLKKMHKGGVRFMGVGLESASSRLNKLMGKYNEEVTIEDFNKFAENCFKAGINLHFYTIFGFPTETKKEINLTKKFLLQNLKKYPFFTFTPSSFGLNKGTIIFNSPEKFNLKFINDDVNQTFIKTFYEKNIENNKYYLAEVLTKLKNAMFFDYGYLLNFSKDFWYFIEHSRLFHIYKMFYKKNPFLEFWQKNKKINKNNYLNKKFSFIKYFEIFEIKGEIFIKNWVNLVVIKINKDISTFILNYNSQITFKANISKENIRKEDFDILYLLIKKHFFIDDGK